MRKKYKRQMEDIQKKTKEIYKIIGMSDDKITRVPTKQEMISYMMEIDRAFCVGSKKVRFEVLDLTGAFFMLVEKLTGLENEI